MAHILCIEDDTELSQLVDMILTHLGHRVTTAAHGRTGLEILMADPPHLILLDLMMPDIDGWEIHQKLKTQPATAHIPVIVVSARAHATDKALALHVNQVDDYITKPFTPTQLIDSVERALRQHAPE